MTTLAKQFQVRFTKSLRLSILMCTFYVMTQSGLVTNTTTILCPQMLKDATSVVEETDKVVKPATMLLSDIAGVTNKRTSKVSSVTNGKLSNPSSITEISELKEMDRILENALSGEYSIVLCAVLTDCLLQCMPL